MANLQCTACGRHQVCGTGACCPQRGAHGDASLRGTGSPGFPNASRMSHLQEAQEEKIKTRDNKQSNGPHFQLRLSLLPALPLHFTLPRPWGQPERGEEGTVVQFPAAGGRGQECGCLLSQPPWPYWRFGRREKISASLERRSSPPSTRDIASATAIPVDQTIAGTVLYHSSAPGGFFSGFPRLMLAQALSSRPGVAAIHVNLKRNVVAADASTRVCLEQLLRIKELRGIPVTAREPADHKTSTGYLHRVDGKPAVDSLLPASSLGYRCLLPSGRGARPRPLQCQQCDWFGHVKESSSWPGSCISCGRAHPVVLDCPLTRPRCINSGGLQPANTLQCPRWQEQWKVDTILTLSTASLCRMWLLRP
ncbi:hypothetical protein MRX96_004516 [Rhipicephalus microplus]